MELLQSHTFLEAYPLRHYRLANGLDVLLLHNPISPVVAYLTHYTVGSASEGDAERGLAHFFEHMMFRETDRLADGDFDRIVAEAGGVGLNAFTSYDTTAYHVNVPAAQLARVVELEADRMAHLHLSSELIEVERGAVLGEMNMYRDMPSEQMWNTLMAEAFPAHPYRHPIIGYTEQVQGFADEDFRRFYQRHYAPNRAVVVVAGGFEEDAVLRLLEEAYGSLPRGAERPAPAPPDPPWEASRRRELEHARISSAYLMLAARSPGLQHEDLPALIMLAAVLGGGQSAPLHRAIVNTGLGTSASAHTLETEMMLASPGLFLLDVDVQHGVPAERVEEALHGLLAGLGRDGVPAAELERARNQVRLNLFGRLSTNMNMARHLGGYHVACGDALHGQALLAALQRVTAEDVQRVLHTYLLQAPLLTVVQRPAAAEAAA